jgi:hypothetical protein
MGRTTGYLTKEYTATGAIPANRIVNWGAADGSVALATDGTKEAVGVSSELDTEANEYCSVFRVGNIAEVEFGAAVGRGQPLTADAQGRAIPATTAGQFVVGNAESSGVLGTIGTVTVQPHIFTPAA